MLRNRMLAALIIGLATAPALAATDYGAFKPDEKSLEKVYSEQYDACIEKSGGVTSNLLDCGGEEFGRLDKKLNSAYQAALSKLSDKQKREALRQTQRGWLKTRWTECDAPGETDGGTADQINAQGCRLGEMARRVLWLQDYQL